MTRLVGQRLVESLIVLLIMSFLVYGLMYLMPGDPLDLALSADPRARPEDIEALKKLWGVDQPFFDRYFGWLGNALTGDFGNSRTEKRPVAEVMLPNLGRTAILMIAAFVLSVIIAIPIGVIAAANPYSRLDYSVNLFSFAGRSVPAFWLALLLILLFAVELRWLPASGVPTDANAGFLKQMEHLILPVLSLTLLSVAGFTRFVRAETVSVLRQDYIRTARAKGLSRRQVLTGHALRNAMIPVITIIALDFGTLFSGALITETVFSYPGMGKMIYDAIIGSDYNLALIGFLFATFVTLLANLLADIAYVAVDPRISYQ